jgi:GrpB-like predicted nucleotidyltransferase (UPF0157 family)/SAM-dependent methyltransferase
MPDPVVIEDYDAAWPEQFAQLRDRVLSVAGDIVLRVEHVGSTAIPGLAAKPVIDLDVVVARADDVSQVAARLESVGYRREGDLGVPGRAAFDYPPGERRHHLYVCPASSPALRRHLQFRDRLRADPGLAAEYGELKQRLATEYGHDRDGYTEAKSAFIESVVTRAGQPGMQNIYDDPRFFDGYRRMRESGSGLHETIIRPLLGELLPPLADKRVIDVGSGDGWLCRLAAAAGAREVLGIDPSQRMLGLARERTDTQSIRYVDGFIEDVRVEDGWADVVLSVLALHYVRDLDDACGRIAGWLAPGGTFACVLEHPIYLAPVPDRGFGTTADRRPTWLLHSYCCEGERSEDWFVPGVVKFHRTVASIVNAVTGAGLVLERLSEPLTQRSAASRDELAQAEARPVVLALRASKP